MIFEKLVAGKRNYLFLIIFFLQISLTYSQSDEDCFMCHEDTELVSEIDGRSMYVDGRIIIKSVHNSVSCASCHKDAAVDDFPHNENLNNVNCGDCHTKADDNFYKGIHGQALKLNELYAPTCTECHGEHTILPTTDPKSLTYKMNIPFLCGKCHKEGAPVSRAYNITEHNILDNYSQSIHGQGLFNSGLIVTATCNNCHGNHLVLPHNNPNSSISANNVAKTCMKCHARIEDVHVKVIKGELWEEAPGAIPACTDCHPPHKINVKNIKATMSDNACLKCHSKDGVHKVVDGEKISLKVERADLDDYEHKKITCVKCHTDVSPFLERPCETAKEVDCDNCHAEVSNKYFTSGHGQAYFRKDENAPYCTDCHGSHKVKSRYDETAPTYRTAIPNLCGKCHSKDNKAIEGKGLKEVDAYFDYSSSVHGKSLEEKGLTITAVCTDCHTTHNMLKESDENSSVNPQHLVSTCAKCHKPIADEYLGSIHSFENESDKELPTCGNCHSAHMISRIDQDEFMIEITHQCGSCHEHLSETYLETYHGKAYLLGYLKTARCSDCHGAHNILSVNNPDSEVGIHNIVATCQKCHPDANERFTGYLTHATHNDKNKYPALYYAFWAMTFLLVGVFGFYGFHTLLWIPRSIIELRKNKHVRPEGKVKYVRRFSYSQRITHIFVIISFILLALTGMIIKFAHMEWAQFITNALGGVYNASMIHRFGALITFGYFGFHLYSLIKQMIERKKSFRQFVFGSNSLMFNMQDWRDLGATLKWFIGKGTKPNYGRWTYWEKFDYMAVFWGVAVIGFSGLMLWFPEFFSRALPGWVINVVQIIHSDEALLATGFIFTVHFFHTHFRPEAFPMDTVIFTGLTPLDEFKKDRPKEYKELVDSGRLEKVIVEKEITKWKLNMVKAAGFFFLGIGITLVILIIYSLLAG
ncbi:MAG: hypothetical protein GQ564_07065 [Bacteroidales bacterium]|nr:hypothetical protein [Bacteroidales bacterium]